MEVKGGTKLKELLESKEPTAKRSAKRLAEFLHKAAECGYQRPEYTQLRQQYKDVV